MNSRTKNNRKNQSKYKSRIRGFVAAKVGRLKRRREAFLSRRPHRSFKMTRRRDYRRSLKIPGYWSLQTQVFGMIWKNRKLFLGLALLYAVLAVLLSSMVSQETYSELREAVSETADANSAGRIMSSFAVLWGVVLGQLSGASSASTSGVQQSVIVIVSLYTWLATIWASRAVLAGKQPRVRDAVYNSGGPVIAMLVLSFILMLQLIPAGLSLVAYTTAAATGILDQTAALMLLGGGALLLMALSVYWATSTMIALVVVTLPGVGPLEAIRMSGDIVVGRRIRVLMRLVWSMLSVAAIWVIVMIPIILIDEAIKMSIPGLTWLPLVPLTAVLLMALTIIFIACYIYVFYRRMVEDDASPA